MIKVAAVAVGAIAVIYAGVSAYAAASTMPIPRLPLGETPASVGLDYEDVSFPSRVDNVTLKGWFIPGEKRFSIIVVNGGWRNRVDLNVGTLEMSRDLVGEGFSLLLFDLRGRGESEGKGLVLIHVERDIGGAVDYIRSRGYPAENIGIIGFSTGAASSLIFASQESIAGIVSNGSFANVYKMSVRGAKQKDLPRPLVKCFFPGVLLMAKVMYGYHAVNPVDVVADVACPILFIHGEQDRGISVEAVYELFEASGNPSDKLWVVPNVEHSQAYKTSPLRYVEMVANFFDTKGEHIPGEEGSSKE
jgi:alpha-beta hydrolase superfamily lysophospholipase